MADEIGAAAAAAAPSFGALVDTLEEGALKSWVVEHEKELRQGYDQNLEIATARSDDLTPFQPEQAKIALQQLAFHESGQIRIEFSRPCCKKKPFIWPFCNPDC